MSSSKRCPLRSEVWWITLDPVVGHEQGRRHPGLIISVDEFNEIPHGLVWIVPITSKLKRSSFTVDIEKRSSGLPQNSLILCHQLRTVSVERLNGRIGKLNDIKMEEVLQRIELILGLS